ncbi:hypothetical protein ACEUZ9_000945 [Paracoccus litorisediminis]|uniref:hypothetical protein n=1 Tax=Paracoccus litorisediminis TaxID=2006130 RepID=UPI0037336B91
MPVKSAAELAGSIVLLLWIAKGYDPRRDLDIMRRETGLDLQMGKTKKPGWRYLRRIGLRFPEPDLGQAIRAAHGAAAACEVSYDVALEPERH